MLNLLWVWAAGAGAGRVLYGRISGAPRRPVTTVPLVPAPLNVLLNSYTWPDEHTSCRLQTRLLDASDVESCRVHSLETLPCLPGDDGARFLQDLALGPPTRWSCVEDHCYARRRLVLTWRDVRAGPTARPRYDKTTADASLGDAHYADEREPCKPGVVLRLSPCICEGSVTSLRLGHLGIGELV
jgi:hypothetical protein